MSDPYLPTEILDHIVDHLHDEEDELMSCCLVSKSWIPRTRKHLFADIEFATAKRLQSWKKTFPDPSTSPTHYAKALTINCSSAFTAVDAETGGWIRGFSRVEHLTVDLGFHQSAAPLIPIHGFSPVIKSFRVIFRAPPFLQVFNLILSFPLLEDLNVIIFEPSPDSGVGSEEDEIPTTTQLSSPPMFTGSLELYSSRGMEPFALRLLSLPSGIHFRKLTLTWLHEGAHLMTTALVERCSHTLESLDIDWILLGTSTWHLHLQ